MWCSGVANSVASPPAAPDIRRRAGLVLATQRHIIGASEDPPSLHGQRQSRASRSGAAWQCVVTVLAVKVAYLVLVCSYLRLLERRHAVLGGEF